ncbi:MAG: peptide-methionine (S)-S-oxide reductase MsrA [Planctomycetota bacterium]
MGPSALQPIRLGLSLALSALLAVAGCTTNENGGSETVGNGAPTSQTSESEVVTDGVSDSNTMNEATNQDPDQTPIVTLGAGCFWCIEAVLEQVDGIESVESGYMGGHVPNPTYQQICTKTTGHAEVVQVRYDPEKISFYSLLRWFWQSHDPTTLNRQGADIGPQYRSAIFVHSDAQRVAAEASMAAAQEQFSDPIVTEIVAASEFYVAEEYHQDFYRNNRANGYCRAVIAPKLDKLGLQK